MTTFGKLVTRIRRYINEIYDDMMQPGADQILGPAYAYGKLFLIDKYIRQLHEAVAGEKSHLQSLENQDSELNDPRLWKVVDSIKQCLAMIGTYEEDPETFSHPGIGEWLRQEAIDCGLVAVLLPEDIVEEGKISSYSLTVISNQFTVYMSCLGDEITSIEMKFKDQPIEFPEIRDWIKSISRRQLSNMLSLTAKLTEFGDESVGITKLAELAAENSALKLSMGGLAFPFVDGYHALLTVDSYESERCWSVVIDRPIAFPVSQLPVVSELCGFQYTGITGGPLSSILKLGVDVQRVANGQNIRFLLSDEQVPCIALARLPLRIQNLESLEVIAELLRRAVSWSHVISDIFSTAEDVQSKISIVINPNDDFSFGITYWVREFPATLNVLVNSDGSLTTDNDEFNQAFGLCHSFPEVLMHLLQ